MSDSSQHQYNQPPPDIMPKGLAINGMLPCTYKYFSTRYNQHLNKNYSQ